VEKRERFPCGRLITFHELSVQPKVVSTVDAIKCARNQSRFVVIISSNPQIYNIAMVIFLSPDVNFDLISTSQEEIGCTERPNFEWDVKP